MKIKWYYENLALFLVTDLYFAGLKRNLRSKNLQVLEFSRFCSLLEYLAKFFTKRRYLITDQITIFAGFLLIPECLNTVAAVTLGALSRFFLPLYVTALPVHIQPWEMWTQFGC